MDVDNIISNVIRSVFSRTIRDTHSCRIFSIIYNFILKFSLGDSKRGRSIVLK